MNGKVRWVFGWMFVYFDFVIGLCVLRVISSLIIVKLLFVVVSVV